TQGDEPAAPDSQGAMSQVTKDSDAETPQAEQTADDTAEAAKAALESTETEAEQEQSQEEAESVIAQILPKAEETPAAQPKPEQRVPVSELVRERQRRQAAEKKAADLEAARTETPTVEEKSPLEKFVEENPDDDFVPAAVQLEQRKWDEARARQAADAHQKAETEARQAAEAEAQRITAQQTLATKAETSEKDFRKDHSDYEAVTRPFVAGRKLTAEQLQDIASADNPAQRLYEVCKAERDLLRGALGIETVEEPANQAPGEQGKPSGEESGGEMTDDDIFKEVDG
ncbi:MAG: hypothetical protein ACYS0H_27340, partial [Planctomycetota bacterium]